MRGKDLYQTSESASKRHKELAKLFQNSNYFKLLIIKQEVLVKDLNPYVKNTRLHVDWYIPSLRVAIEINGEQHYKITDFGGEGIEKATRNYVAGKHRDIEKARALEEAGIALVEIPPKMTINESTIIDAIEKAIKELPEGNQVKEDSHKIKAREYRRRQYKQWKGNQCVKNLTKKSLDK